MDVIRIHVETRMQRRDFLKASLAAAAVSVAGLYGLDQLASVNAATLTIPSLAKRAGSAVQVISSTIESVQSLQASYDAQTTSTSSTTASTTDSGVIPDELQVPHLLRRASFGATPIELQNYQDMGFEGAVDYLLNYRDITSNDVPAAPNIALSYSGQQTGNPLQALQTWWLQRMVGTHALSRRR